MNPSIRYILDIDEEGFPVFDGLRVNDDALVAQLLGGIRRLDPANPRSLLVTECEGELCAVNAFDAPLVAQSVDGPEWVFPGNVRHRVALENLRFDEWGRGTTFVEPHLIPAILSRKAQASLLLAKGAEISALKPKAVYTPKEPVRGKEFWEQAYRQKNDGWELHGPSPVLVENFAAVRAVLPADARVLVPGAGRGHDAAWLAEQGGMRVTALDFASDAASEFRRVHPGSPVDYRQADVFAYLSGTEKFDAIFEHTLFCAIDPVKRAEFLDRVHRSLRPGGIYFGIFWMKTAPGGPPFPCSQWELRQRTQAFFEPRAWSLSKASIPSRWGQELWAILRAP